MWLTLGLPLYSMAKTLVTTPGTDVTCTHSCGLLQILSGLETKLLGRDEREDESGGVVRILVWVDVVAAVAVNVASEVVPREFGRNRSRPVQHEALSGYAAVPGERARKRSGRDTQGRFRVRASESFGDVVSDGIAGTQGRFEPDQGLAVFGLELDLQGVAHHAAVRGEEAEPVRLRLRVYVVEVMVVAGVRALRTGPPRGNAAPLEKGQNGYTATPKFRAYIHGIYTRKLALTHRLQGFLRVPLFNWYIRHGGPQSARRSRSSQRPLRSERLRQEAKEPFGEAAQAQVDLIRCRGERLPRGEGVYETRQGQIRREPLRNMIFDTVVDEIVTERFPPAHPSNYIRTEHGFELLYGIRVKERSSTILIQQILETRSSVEQTYEPDLEGCDFVPFGHNRHDNASGVDLREDRCEHYPYTVTAWSGLSGHSPVKALGLAVAELRRGQRMLRCALACIRIDVHLLENAEFGEKFDGVCSVAHRSIVQIVAKVIPRHTGQGCTGDTCVQESDMNRADDLAVNEVDAHILLQKPLERPENAAIVPHKQVFDDGDEFVGLSEKFIQRPWVAVQELHTHTRRTEKFLVRAQLSKSLRSLLLGIPYRLVQERRQEWHQNKGCCRADRLQARTQHEVEQEPGVGGDQRALYSLAKFARGRDGWPQPCRMEWETNSRPSRSASSIARSSRSRASRHRRSLLVRRWPCAISSVVQYNSASRWRSEETCSSIANRGSSLRLPSSYSHAPLALVRGSGTRIW
jgi:hypothetical protein